MKAYMLKSNKAIEPFGQHPRECLLINRKLGELQNEVLNGAGHILMIPSDISDINDPEEHVVFVDSLYFTPDLLREFINRSRKVNKRTVFAAGHGLTTLRSITRTQDVAIHPQARK